MKLAILGDFIIDDYIYYRSKKLSPESPCPVVQKVKYRQVAGGAANVANSTFSIGLDVHFIFCTSKNLEKYNHLLFNYPIFTYKRDNFDFSKKTRHCVDNIQFFREDKEKSSNLFLDCFENLDKIINYLKKNNIENVLISDYQKGALTPNEVKYLLEKCKKFNIRTFIDTKINSPDYLEHAYLLKPNLKEFQKLTGCLAKAKNHKELINELEPFARKLMVSKSIDNCIVTLSELGSVWYRLNKEIISYMKSKISVIDIVGAGDSFISGLLYTFADDKKYSTLQKLKISNYFAEISIKEEGTNPISKKSFEKMLSDFEIADVGFTNGCFDILHPGHISLLKQAKEKCKHLIVGLNSDSSIKRLKGNSRPVNKQEDRKKVLENVKWVDEVLIFDEDTPLNLIKKVEPDLLVKGADYNIKQVVGADFVIQNGGMVFLAELLNTPSTSDRVNSMIN